MAEFTIRVASIDDAAPLADVERAADRHYVETIHADLLDDDAIPDDVARRYCEEGRVFVAEVGERLVFVEGDVAVPPYPEWARTEEALASTALLIRGLHDASIGLDPDDATWNRELADRHTDDGDPGQIVICHNDVCMENVVFRDERAVALLDFDFAAPGRRSHDVAAFARMCVPIDDDAGAALPGWRPADRPNRLAVIADAYGLDNDQRSLLLACLDASIAGGGQFVLRRVEAGEQAFIEMWNNIGGMARYDARRADWAADRTHFATALGL